MRLEVHKLFLKLSFKFSSCISIIRNIFNGLISVQMLLDAGAMVDAEDVEGNTPLHVKCYGESNKPSDLTSIELLLNKNASLSKRNTRVIDIVLVESLARVIWCRDQDQRSIIITERIYMQSFVYYVNFPFKEIINFKETDRVMYL